MEFSRQEYWSTLSFPTLGNLPDPGIKLRSLTSPALAGGFFTPAPPGKPQPPSCSDLNCRKSFLETILFYILDLIVNPIISFQAYCNGLLIIFPTFTLASFHSNVSPAGRVILFTWKPVMTSLCSKISKCSMVFRAKIKAFQWLTRTYIFWFTVTTLGKYVGSSYNSSVPFLLTPWVSFFRVVFLLVCFFFNSLFLERAFSGYRHDQVPITLFQALVKCHLLNRSLLYHIMKKCNTSYTLATTPLFIYP